MTSSKPDIKLYDDRIEIAGTMKGDLNNGGNFDINAGKGEIKCGSIEVDKIGGLKDLSVGSIEVDKIDGLRILSLDSISVDKINGLYANPVGSIFANQISGDIHARNISVEPGVDGVFKVSYLTKEDHTVEGWLAKDLYLKPDGILFTIRAEGHGTMFSFDLLPSFNALVARVDELVQDDMTSLNMILELRARVDTLEKSLHQQISKEAYRLWEAGGHQSGRDLDYWLMAKRDILGEQLV